MNCIFRRILTPEFNKSRNKKHCVVLLTKFNIASTYLKSIDIIQILCLHFQGLKPYSPYQAVGMRMLNNVAKGKFAKSDIYWAHAALNSDDRADVALVSDK